MTDGAHKRTLFEICYREHTKQRTLVLLFDVQNREKRTLARVSVRPHIDKRTLFFHFCNRQPMGTRMLFDVSDRQYTDKGTLFNFSDRQHIKVNKCSASLTDSTQTREHLTSKTDKPHKNTSRGSNRRCTNVNIIHVTGFVLFVSYIVIFTSYGMFCITVRYIYKYLAPFPVVFAPCKLLYKSCFLP